jgi:hypothetical protein
MTLRAYQEPMTDDQASQLGENSSNLCVCFRDLVGTITHSSSQSPGAPIPLDAVAY